MPVRFSAILYKGDNFSDFLFTFLHIMSLLKGATLKELSPNTPPQQIF